MESSRRCDEPSLSDLESSLGSGDMGSSAMVRVGALLVAAVVGALELPGCIDKQGFISTGGLDWGGWYLGVFFRD